MRGRCICVKRFFDRKHVWLIAGYFALYLLGFQLLEARGPKELHLIHTVLDDRIPFCEYFIVPYVLWFFYVAAAVAYFAFFQKSVKEYWQFMISLGIGMTLFLLVSWFWPNGHDLRPKLPEDGSGFVEMVRMLYRIDTPTNILPSIHVFNSLAVAAAVDRCRTLEGRRILRRASWVLAGLIVLSTMFLKQHSVFDVLCGITLYGAVYRLVYIRKAFWPVHTPQKRPGWARDFD